MQSRSSDQVQQNATVQHPQLTVVRHPLLDSKLALLRQPGVQSGEFRRLASDISRLLLWEIMRTFPTQDIEVPTPLGLAPGRELAAPLVLVPILRAGLGMLDGMLSLVEHAQVGHIGLFRDEETLTPVGYYTRLPDLAPEARVLVIDPMLATGHTCVEAIYQVKQHGAQHIIAASIVSCPQGIAEVAAHHPQVPIYTAAVDEKLNDNGYIVPGLGDAGDRLYAT